ncbi:MAG TPA: type II secretion system F family protein [Rickettsiales bacterium]|nr:type II secretion system F family protein [Rickettsiales bacterium]
MPYYKYSAINDAGRTIKGVVTAENDVDLEDRLKQLGLDLINYKELREKKGSSSGKVKIQDLIVCCLHLEQLGRAGVSLLEAIADVRDTTDSPVLKNIMAGVYEYIKNGEILSKALAHYPHVFNEVFVGLIAAGEKTGNFSEAFLHIADHLKWTSDLRRKVKKAVRYPLALLLVMSGVISVLMVFVVPKLVDFMVAQGFDLPLHTRALIAFSHAFVNYWYLIFGLPILAVGGFFLLYNTSEPFAYNVDGFVLKIPVLGSVSRKINLARFTHFFSVLFNSGIGILESLQAAKNVVANRVLQESVDMMTRSVSEGMSLTAAMRVSNQFPSLVVRMFKIGEDSGNMTESLENVNFFYEREINDAVENVVGLIQPALTIVMGLLIFWVIAAVFGPLYQSFSKMNV